MEELKRKLLIAKERKEELERKVRKLTETKRILEAEGARAGSGTILFIYELPWHNHSGVP